MTKTFFTSDMHFGHARIQEFQPLRWQGTVEGMNDWLVDNWNSVVGPDDTVWVLGDVAMGKLDNSLPVSGQLNGYKILVAGNHDRMSPAYHGNMSDEKIASWTDRYMDEGGFDEVHIGTLSTTLDGFGIVDTCHFPYLEIADHVDDREAQYDRHRPVDVGRVLLHGHVHGAYGAITGPRSIDVGIDVPDWGFKPVEDRVLVDMINSPEMKGTIV